MASGSQAVWLLFSIPGCGSGTQGSRQTWNPTRSLLHSALLLPDLFPASLKAQEKLGIRKQATPQVMRAAKLV